MKILVAVRRSLRLLTKRSRTLLLLATVLTAGTALLDLAGVIFLGIVVALALAQVSGDPLPQVLSNIAATFGVTQSELQAAIGPIALLGAGFLILRSVAVFYISIRVTRFLANRQARVSAHLIGIVLAWPLSRVRAHNSQQLAYAITGGAQLAVTAVLGQGVVIISEISLLLALSAGLVAVSPLTTLFTFGYLIMIGLLLHFVVANYASQLGKEAAHNEIKTRSTLIEAFSLYPELTVLGRRESFIDSLTGLRQIAANLTARSQVIGIMPKYIFEIALIFGALLLIVAQLRTREIPAAIGTVAVFLLAGSRIVPSIQRMQTATLTIRESAAGAEPTYELSEEGGPESVSVLEVSWSGTNYDSVNEFVPTVSLRGVGFDFQEESNFQLREVDLEIPAGSSASLVGPSGAGKSTLANIILGLQEPTRGTVTIGGVSPREAIRTWPGAIAYVPQEIVVIEGSIRANVALGLAERDIDEGTVLWALERARLLDFLQDQRDGIETQVGEFGVRLSGGQKQRLGLARALYARPKLVVLDEATSALDSETEALIAETFESMKGQVTLVTIAHRLATVRDSNLVVYLDAGTVVAKGTFEEVRNEVPDFDRQAALLGLAGSS